MENKSLVSGALILVALCLGLFFVLYLIFEPKEETVINTTTIHDYDYLIEVSDGDTDSSLNYTLYDQNHVLIGDSLNCKELDSIIIDDNL